MGSVRIGGQRQSGELRVGQAFVGIPTLRRQRGQATGLNLAGRGRDPSEVKRMADEEAGTRSLRSGRPGRCRSRGDPAERSSKAPGWYPSPTNPTDQIYWDGQGWTARSRWTAGQGMDSGGRCARRGDGRLESTTLRAPPVGKSVCPDGPPGPGRPGFTSTWASSCSWSAGSPSCTGPSASGCT